MAGRWLLDTSALLALCDDESGAERVAGLLRLGHVQHAGADPWIAAGRASFLTVGVEQLPNLLP